MLKTLLSLLLVSMFVYASEKPGPGDELVTKIKASLVDLEKKAQKFDKELRTAIHKKAEELKKDLKIAEEEVEEKKDKALNKVADGVHSLEKEIRGHTAKGKAPKK